MGLLERDELVTRLEELLVAAGQRRGSLVLVAGEAGAGKSSLVTEFVGRVGSEVQVLLGACDPLSTPRPLGPLFDFAADIDPGLIVRLDAGQAGIEMFTDVLAHLGAGAGGVVLIVEDAHWADDGTLDLVRYLGRRIGNSFGVVLVTYRDDELTADHPLRTVIGQVGRLETTVRMKVPPLSGDALRTLAEDSGLDVDRLEELTAGNAFYATEVLAGGGELPESVQDAVLARLQQASEGVRRLAEVVSIAPRRIPPAEAALLAEVSVDQAREAVAGGLLIDDGELRFRHEIARLAVSDAIAPSRRRAMHSSMLTMLEGKGSSDLSRLAHHAIRGADPARVLRYAPEAAALASAQGAHRQAAEWLTAAVEGSNDAHGGELAELRRRLADELATIDQHDRAAAQLEQTADHYRRVGDNGSLAATLGELSQCYWRTQRRQDGRAALDEALRVLPVSDIEGRAQIEYLRGYGEMLARALGPAEAAIARSRSLAGDTAPAALRFGQDLVDACIRVTGADPDGGLAELLRMRRRAAAEGRVRDEIILLHMAGSGGGEARRYDIAIPALEEAVQLGVQNDEDFSVNYARSWLARVAFEQGCWSDATGLAEEVATLAGRRDGIAVMTATGALGRVRVRRGDPGGSAVLEDLLTEHESYEIQHVWSPLCGLIESEWLHGRITARALLLEQTWARAAETDSPWARGEVGFWMWRLGSFDSAPDRAAEPFALQMDGDWRSAAEAWRALGCPYEEALALADGDKPAMGEALVILDGLGARPAASWLRARMRSAGVEYIARGPIGRTRDNPAELTDRQLEVLGLMRDGLTNAEIAASLFVSKKTVEHHVSAVFTKLGVRDRPKAIAAAHALLADT